MIDNDHTKRYTLKFRLKTYLFIGDGNIIDKSETIFNDETKSITVVNKEKLADIITKNESLEQDYEDFITKNKCDKKNDIKNFLNDKEIPYESVGSYTLSLKGNLDNVNKNNDIMTFIKRDNHDIYVPGSIVKSFLSNCLMTYIIKNNSGYKNLENVYYNRFDINPNELDENKGFKKLKDLRRQIDSAIEVSDSESIGAGSLVYGDINYVNNSIYDNGKIVLSPYCEMLEMGTKITLYLTLNSDVDVDGDMHIDIDCIKNSIKDFDPNYFDFYIKCLSEDFLQQSSFNVFRLGNLNNPDAETFIKDLEDLEHEQTQILDKIIRKKFPKYRWNSNNTTPPKITVLDRGQNRIATYKIEKIEN